MNTSTTDNGRIRFGGAMRLPAAKPVSPKIALGGAMRLPAAR